MDKSHTNPDFYGKNDEKAVSEGERNHIEDNNKNASLLDCIPGTQRCSHNSQISEDDAKTHNNAEENVAGKVEEVTISQTLNDSLKSSGSVLLETTTEPEAVVRDLESHHLLRLGKKSSQRERGTSCFLQLPFTFMKEEGLQ